jgi:hypothetical protein
MGYDARFNLGFVSNPKRLNVAISRTKALLVIVGSAKVLWTDPNWRRLMEHIIENNVLVGAEFIPPPPPSAPGASPDVADHSELTAIERLLERITINV